jgi:hypothetical protein
VACTARYGTLHTVGWAGEGEGGHMEGVGWGGIHSQVG